MTDPKPEPSSEFMEEPPTPSDRGIVLDDETDQAARERIAGQDTEELEDPLAE
jgi:hypothetical protein